MFSFFGSLLAGALGVAGSVLGAKAQKQSYDDNLALQQQQFAYQIASDNWARQFASENEAFNRNAFQRQMDLAKSPVSTVVNDGRSVGVNPMAALGQSAGSASYSSSSAPSAGASVSPVSMQDGIMTSLMNSLTSLATSKMNNDTTRQIADKQASLKQQELDIIEENNLANIGLGSERNEISRAQTEIQQQLADANDRLTEGQLNKWLNDNAVSLRTIALQEASEKFRQNFSDKEFAQRVTEFNKTYDNAVKRLEAYISTSDKNRRMQYITRFASLVGNLISSFFGRGGSIPTFSDGFLDNMLSQGGL